MENYGGQKYDTTPLKKSYPGLICEGSGDRVIKNIVSWLYFPNFVKNVCLLRTVFAFILFCFAGAQALGLPRYENYRMVHDFSQEWLMYDHQEKVYVPYRNDPDQELKSYSLNLTLSSFPRAYLLIKTGDKSCNLFIDQALDRVSKGDEWIIYSIDSLRRQYKKEKIYISLLSLSGPSEIVAYVGFPSGGTAQVKGKEGAREVVRLMPRTASRINSGVAIAFVLSLVVMSFVSSNYFRVFGKYFSLREVLSSRVKEDLFMIGKPLDRPNLFFVILLSVMVGLFFLLLENGGWRIIEGSILFQSGNTFAVYAINYFKICLIVFVLYVLKFFFLNIVGKLFNLGKVTDLHYFKVVQCSVFFFSLLLVLTLVMYNTYIQLPNNLDGILFILLIIFFVWRALLIYFTINRESNVKFLYLFSYLCIAEGLPVILVLRLLF
jgi:hypothetical protein